MFEELDDPNPDLRASDALPAVQARGQVLRRRRRVAAASGAGATTALVVALALVLPGDGSVSERLVPAGPSPSTTSVSPPVTPTPSAPARTPLPSASATLSTPSATVPLPSAPPNSAPPNSAPPNSAPPNSAPPNSAPPISAPPAPPVTSAGPTSVPQTRPGPSTGAAAPAPQSTPPASSTSPQPEPSAPGTLQLGGDDLGVTAVGASRARAVAAVRAVLGAPTGDPSTSVDCVNAYEEVAWPGFRLGFDSAGQLTGWSSTSRQLATPPGVSVGTTVERLEQLYGDRLHLSASDSESGDTYTVDGVAILGSLTGTAASDRVVALRNGSCIGP